MIPEPACSRRHADVSSPVFSLTVETYRDLETKANNRAYEDAARQRDDFVKRCGFTDLRLDSIGTPQNTIYPTPAPQQGAGSQIGTVIIPPQLKVSASWEFIWSFVPGTTCQP